MHKLKVIIQTSELIIKSVVDFYKQLDINYPVSEISPDDIMTIFVYIVAKCKVHTLYAQLNFLERFLPDNILSSLAGYYFTTLKACVQYFSEIDFESQKKELAKDKSI